MPRQVVTFAVSLLTLVLLGSCSLGTETPGPGAMILVVDPSLGFGEGVVELPLGGSYDVTIDWGDGSPAVAYSDADEDMPSHTYEDPGTYEIAITGSVDIFGRFDVQTTYLTSVESWGNLGIQGLPYAFYATYELTSLPASLPETVTDLSFLFYNSGSNLEAVAAWDTRNVTNMRATFHLTTTFDQDVGGWNTSNVTDMSQMFAGATAFDRDIGGWDTSNVTNMSAMFSSARAFDRDLSSWTPGCAVQGQIIAEPEGFDEGATAWTLVDSRPAWGADCP